MINTYQLTPEYKVNVYYDHGPHESVAERYDTVFYEIESCNNLDIHEGDASIIAALEDVEEAA